jgi:tetratricopeptide (TPR) repeat protein
MEIGVLDEFQVSSEDERSKIPFHRVIQICDCLRQLGNDFYTQLNFGEAVKKYRKAVYFLENRSAQNEDEDKKMSGMLKKLYLNVSQCYLKLSKPKRSIYYCKLVLMNDESNVKALYRYGKVNFNNLDFNKKFLIIFL